MPRPRRVHSQVVVPRTALTASAHRYTGKTPRIYAPTSQWQTRCYHHYHHCGEARFAATYFGQAMSRACLYVEDKQGDRATTGADFESLNALFGGEDGQSEMLMLVGIHLTVAGECYLIGRVIDGADVWEVLAVTEVQGNANGWKMKAADSELWVDLEESDSVIRVWVPSPDRRWEADSPFRSLLPILDEIERITKYIHAQTISRLASNGILFLPNGMTFPPPPSKDGKERKVANEADSFLLSFGSMAMEALEGNGSPSEVVPFVVMADMEQIAAAKHMEIATKLDENAGQMRKDAVMRFATGMDLPKEAVLGMSSNEGTGGGSSNGVSHWGAWMIEEQAIKIHIEPKLDTLCAAVNSLYLRLQDDYQGGRIKADTSTLRLRPDRSKESIELFNLGWLKGTKMVQENGFDPEKDIPDETERKEWLLMKIAGGSATPEQVAGALKALGVDLGLPEGGQGEVPRETRPDPSITDHPIRPRDPSESPYAVYEGLVLRALERGGNRLRNLTQTRTTGDSWEAHTHVQCNGFTDRCLEDAFPTAEMQLGADLAEIVVPVLAGYVRHLYENQQPYCRDDLYGLCTDAGL